MVNFESLLHSLVYEHTVLLSTHTISSGMIRESRTILELETSHVRSPHDSHRGSMAYFSNPDSTSPVTFLIGYMSLDVKRTSNTLLCVSMDHQIIIEPVSQRHLQVHSATFSVNPIFMCEPSPTARDIRILAGCHLLGGMNTDRPFGKLTLNCPSRHSVNV